LNKLEATTEDICLLEFADCHEGHQGSKQTLN